jgi:hypothetical protein
MSMAAKPVIAIVTTVIVSEMRQVELKTGV